MKIKIISACLAFLVFPFQNFIFAQVEVPKEFSNKLNHSSFSELGGAAILFSVNYAISTPPVKHHCYGVRISTTLIDGIINQFSEGGYRNRYYPGLVGSHGFVEARMFRFVISVSAGALFSTYLISGNEKYHVHYNPNNRIVIGVLGWGLRYIVPFFPRKSVFASPFIGVNSYYFFSENPGRLRLTGTNTGFLTGFYFKLR